MEEFRSVLNKLGKAKENTDIKLSALKCGEPDVQSIVSNTFTL